MSKKDCCSRHGVDPSARRGRPMAGGKAGGVFKNHGDRDRSWAMIHIYSAEIPDTWGQGLPVFLPFAVQQPAVANSIHRRLLSSRLEFKKQGQFLRLKMTLYGANYKPLNHDAPTFVSTTGSFHAQETKTGVGRQPETIRMPSPSQNAED